MSVINREDRAGIAVLTWDQPGSPVNIKTREALAELAAAVQAALADPAVKGLVLASAKRDFVVGGDLAELQAVTSQEDAAARVAHVRTLLRLIERGGKPVVAALNGQALGGGLELALACHARVAAQDAKLGLPEVTLGLMPGAGGTQRLPRLIGADAALPLLTSGRPVPAAGALELGLLDAVMPANELVDAAVALAGTARSSQPWDDSISPAPLSEALLAKARAECARRSGEGDIAEAVIIDTMVRGLTLDFEAALDLEREAFGRLVVSTTAKNLIRSSFFALNRARAMGGRPAAEPPYGLGTVAVVGAGTMGSGIAYAAAASGLAVKLIEAGPEALARGMGLIEKIAAREAKAGRIGADAVAQILGRISPTPDYAGLGDVDLAIEAVIEVESVKAQVIARLAATMRPGAPIASNTSTLPITRLAAHSADPQAFIGLHFFGPVERMPLVEVIRGKATTDATLARALDLLKRMRKTPIVVNDGLGFYTSRVVAAYTGEAMTMLAEGVPPQDIDTAARAFGMVIGPCAMNDMAGFPLLIDIFKSIHSDPGLPSTLGNRSIETMEGLVAAGRPGKREGRGIYDYDEAGKPQPWPGLADLFPPAEAPLAPRDIRDRMIYAQVVEAARALEEGIVTSATDADIGSLLGWMFPKWTGGVLSYIDTVGAPAFVARAEALAERFGGRFTPPMGLTAMAEGHRRYHAA